MKGSWIAALALLSATAGAAETTRYVALVNGARTRPGTSG
jgi:hypothetical protein